MIKYVAPKYDKIPRVKSLLSISARVNHFSNNGPVKELLENKLSEMLGLREDQRVVCLTNGTAALHTLMALKPCQKWACPAFTFPSAVVGPYYMNVDVLDIHPQSYTLPTDSDLLRKYDGIILTTLFGGYLNLAEWDRYCKEEGKVLILDNASSPMTCIGGENICSWTDYSFGSLHHTKYLGVGEGGFIVVPESEYSEALAISNFGFNDNREHHPDSSNYKMSDIAAAHILAHIEKYNVDKHTNIQEEIIEACKDYEVEFLNHAPGVVYGNLPVIFRQRQKADPVYFQSLNIVANKYYRPLAPLPNATRLYNQIINLPLYDSLTKRDIKTIIKAIKTYSEIK